MTRFVWFWTFWHWSKEGFKQGALLRAPLHGVASHWDEWLRHEATERERALIEEAGAAEADQREFIRWLAKEWAPEAGYRANRVVVRFVLGQLAGVQPFARWRALEQFREGYGVGGISAVVLAEGSAGTPGDVRLIEALALPSDATGQTVVTEDFHIDAVDVEIPRRAAGEALRGRGLVAFLALWVGCGRRPYPVWLRGVLGAGWFGVAGLILYLTFGPDPGSRLAPFAAVLTSLALVLIAVGVTTAGVQIYQCWRGGGRLAETLEKSQLRLRMKGGLMVKGGSAGLAFCLSSMLAISRAAGRQTGSWLWDRFFRELRAKNGGWVATGVVTSAAQLKSVVLEPKLRACLAHPFVKHIIIPRQRPALAPGLALPSPAAKTHGVEPLSVAAPLTPSLRLGYASEQHYLQSHACRSVAAAMMVIGGFVSRWQMAVNVIAIASISALLFSAGDLASVLFPPRAPFAVAPASPSTASVWVSLDTRSPERFQVAMESSYWANRRTEVAAHRGDHPSVRAEIALQRLASPSSYDPVDATFWIERRNQFLGREFEAGERVGCYSLRYLRNLGYE